MANSPAMESLLKYRFQRKEKSILEKSKACQSPVFDQKPFDSQDLFDSPIIESKKGNTHVVSDGSSPWFSKNGATDSQPISVSTGSSNSICTLSSEDVKILSHEKHPLLEIQGVFPDMNQSTIEEFLTSCDNDVNEAVIQILKDKNNAKSRKRCFYSPESPSSLPAAKKQLIIDSSDESTPPKAPNGCSRNELETNKNPKATVHSFYNRKLDVEYPTSKPNLDFNLVTQLTNELAKKNPLVQRTEIERVLKSKNYNFNKTNKVLHEMKNMTNGLETISQTENVGSIKGIFASRAHHKLLPVQNMSLREKKPESRQFKKIICHDDSDSDGESNAYSKKKKVPTATLR